MEELLHMYNNCPTDCLDKHALCHNVWVRFTTQHLWYDTDINDARDIKMEMRECVEKDKTQDSLVIICYRPGRMYCADKQIIKKIA